MGAPTRTTLLCCSACLVCARSGAVGQTHPEVRNRSAAAGRLQRRNPPALGARRVSLAIGATQMQTPAVESPWKGEHVRLPLQSEAVDVRHTL